MKYYPSIILDQWASTETVVGNYLDLDKIIFVRVKRKK